MAASTSVVCGAPHGIATCPEDKNHEVIVRENPDGYTRLVFKEDRLVGMLLIQRIKNTGVYTQLIRQRVPLGEMKRTVLEWELNYAHFIKFQPPVLDTIVV